MDIGDKNHNDENRNDHHAKMDGGNHNVNDHDVNHNVNHNENHNVMNEMEVENDVMNETEVENDAKNTKEVENAEKNEREVGSDVNSFVAEMMLISVFQNIVLGNMMIFFSFSDLVS